MVDKLNEGRVAIVTGAGQGIGRAHALAFAAEGAHVVVNDFDTNSAHAVADEIVAAGGKAVPVVSDVADWDAGKDMIAGAVEAFHAWTPGIEVPERLAENGVYVDAIYF